MLAQTTQDLATVRAELQSEKSAHQTTTSQLASAHKDIVQIDKSMNMCVLTRLRQKDLKERMEVNNADLAQRLENEKKQYVFSII